MAVFKELVEHHIKDEESKVFKSAETLDHAEFQNIMKQFERKSRQSKRA